MSPITHTGWEIDGSGPDMVMRRDVTNRLGELLMVVVSHQSVSLMAKPGWMREDEGSQWMTLEQYRRHSKMLAASDGDYTFSIAKRTDHGYAPVDELFGYIHPRCIPEIGWAMTEFTSNGIYTKCGDYLAAHLMLAICPVEVGKLALRTTIRRPIEADVDRAIAGLEKRGWKLVSRGVERLFDGPIMRTRYHAVMIKADHEKE